MIRSAMRYRFLPDFSREIRWTRVTEKEVFDNLEHFLRPDRLNFFKFDNLETSIDKTLGREYFNTV